MYSGKTENFHIPCQSNAKWLCNDSKGKSSNAEKEKCIANVTWRVSMGFLENVSQSGPAVWPDIALI